MTIAPIAVTAVTSTSAATIMLAAAGDGLDVATVTVIGAVACTIITALSVAIVKILGALQELKVAVIKAAEERANAAEKVAANSDKLAEIKTSSDGHLSKMREELSLALTRIDDMQKAAVAKSLPHAPAPTAGPAPGSPEAPIEMIIANPTHNPANVTNIEPKP